MRINLNEVRLFVEKALTDHALIQGSEVFEIKNDLYWCISDDEVHDVSADPSSFEIGSYGDELSILRKKLAEGGLMGKNELKYLASILSYLSADPS